MRKILVISIYLLFLATQSFSQQTVTGRIVDSENQHPIGNVQVFEEGGIDGTTSNSKGIFTLKVSDKTEINLVFSHIGFQILQKTVSQSELSEELKIQLQPKIELLSEVEIMGVSTKNQSYRTEYVDMTVLESTNLQDIGSLLRNVPNVSGVKKGAMGIDPVIRGFKYSQLNVQLNGGTRIEGGCPNRMDPATAHVDLSDLKNINILKGPFALKYGVNFGGVIDMTTYSPEFYEQYKTKVTALLGGQTNHAGFKTKVGVSGANKIVTYNVTGSWKDYNDYKDGNGNWVNASLEQQTYTASLGFKLAKKHILYGTVDVSQGQNIDFPTLPMDERKDDTKIYSLNYYANNLGKSVNFIRAKAYYSDVNHEMDNKNRPFSDTVVAVSNIHAVNAGGKLGVNFNVGEAVMEVGGDYENISKDGTRLKTLIMQPKMPTKEEDLWNNAHIQNTGVFAEYHRPGEIIDWTVAARLDFNSAKSDPLTRTNMMGDAVYSNDSTNSQYTNFSISGGLTWHVGRSGDVVFSLGRGARSPDMTERFIILLPVGYDPYDYLGNPQLEPEVNNEIDLGYKFNSSKIGNFYVSAFYSYVTNYISAVLLPTSEMKPQTSGVLGVKEFVNIDVGNLVGGEITYSTPAKHLWGISFNAAYTMGWNPEATVNIVEDGKVIGEETVENDPLPEIPPFEANLGFSYRLFKNKFIPQLSVRAAAAQNRISQAYNEQSTPGFVLLNLDLQYKFNKYLTVYAGIQNLLNQDYYEHLNRNIIGTTYPLYEPGRVFYANLIFNL
jgi:iron complex outermembrane receptor protein